MREAGSLPDRTKNENSPLLGSETQKTHLDIKNLNYEPQQPQLGELVLISSKHTS